MKLRRYSGRYLDMSMGHDGRAGSSIPSTQSAPSLRLGEISSRVSEPVDFLGSCENPHY